MPPHQPVKIASPVSGDFVGNPIRIGVETHWDGATPEEETVTIQIGANGPRIPATLDETGWHLTADPPSGITAGTIIKITARYRVVTEFDGHSFIDDVTVLLEGEPPTLSVNSFDPTVTAVSLPCQVKLSGTAHDEHSDILGVFYNLNNSEDGTTKNVSGDWSHWEYTFPLNPGEHEIRIKAIDKLGNESQEHLAIILVQTSAGPSKAELATAPTTYLQELMAFANRFLKNVSNGSSPDPQALTKRFLQPYDHLSNAEFYEMAMRPLIQTRIAVEILRKKTQAPTAAEQSFRRVAYEALLAELGTSYQELRAARIADGETRRTLAERLGIGVLSDRPDRLDQITLMRDDITEERLEQLFGFESVTHDDPLHPEITPAEILNWRLERTQERWLKEDRDKTLPIIDPDVIGEANLLTPEPGYFAYDLWKDRQTWLDAQIADVTSHQSQGFEHVINTFIGTINFKDLSEKDVEGQDITPDLNSTNLDLAAFRQLAGCWKLSTAGPLLETEWESIRDIVIQVLKNRRYKEWLAQEEKLSLAPQFFRLADQHEDDGRTVSWWRARPRVVAAWCQTLAGRIREQKDTEDGYRSALKAAELVALPLLRDSLIESIRKQQTPQEDVAVTTERLSRELFMDLRVNATLMTTRVDQAIETLQTALFSIRTGRLGPDASGWSIRAEHEEEFDQEWQWMSAYGAWSSAMQVFIYPESQLYPNFYIKDAPLLNPTSAFGEFIASLRDTVRLTPVLAREKAQVYLTNLRNLTTLDPPLSPWLKAPSFVISDNLDLVKRKALVEELMEWITPETEYKEPNYIREIFWMVPMALALQLQRAGYYLAALDWFQSVYAFNQPIENRKIYYWLELESKIESAYASTPNWLTNSLNPHNFARSRRNAYTCFTVLSIVRCFLDFADTEFSKSTAESVGRARTLYETAADLLNIPEVPPAPSANDKYLPNPIWESLRLHTQTNLAKIHHGLNIAGAAFTTPLTAAKTSIMPSQYRYVTLAERAKLLVSVAQQIESAFLNAMERRDAEAYGLLQAGYDLSVAEATVRMHSVRIEDAELGVKIAGLQRDKAQIQYDYYDNQIKEGLNFWEKTALGSMEVAVFLQAAVGATFLIAGGINAVKAAVTFGILGGDAGATQAAQALSALADAASSTASIAQTKASFERRKLEWELQRSLADKDIQIGDDQIIIAENQRLLALMEQRLARMQLDHAEAVANFLASKFTNAELYEWMSGVLGRVYSYFLQQATAMAQLAQSQLAFERQQTALSVIRSDYWQVSPDDDSGQVNGSGPDRRGLTGSARLLKDIYQLDQYAFDTKQRKLQLTQTLSLAQLTPVELQRFRETGSLIFATPMELFDRDFPGHYLRLVQRIRVSLIALVPPTRGLRATLSASGISRVVTGGNSFETVDICRSPETVAFTSPLNATGLFELEAEGDLLLPFEGMGVDTSWELQLPKAANPFDYRGIADVLLTIEYTALSNPAYRQQVIKQLNGNFSAERIFSIRDQFPDSWYELNNADSVENVEQRMVARFETLREDFPLNVESLIIEHVTLLVSRQKGFDQEIDILSLEFTEEDETDPVVCDEVKTVRGVVTTRRSNGTNWAAMRGKSPIGNWNLRFKNIEEVKGFFKEEKIEDLAFIITVGGKTPEWPA